MIPTGYTCTRAKAQVILQAAGIGPRDPIGVDGLEYIYEGKTYWILELETHWPGPTSTSPDGWHIVYAPSQEEIDISKPKTENPFQWLIDIFNSAKPIMYLLIIAIIAIVIIQGLKVVK